MTKNTTIRYALRAYASEERRKTNEWFFKTGKGEYGEHDRFLGVTNPEVRNVAKVYKDMSFDKLYEALNSPYNEERLCALIILDERYKKGSEDEKAEVYRFYKKNLRYVNNWNLVDLSAPHIMGNYLASHKKEQIILHKLVLSPNMWRRRIAIIASWALIKENDFRVTIELSQKLLHDKEDLMHKAVGWMLREVGKRDQQALESFLDKNIAEMPRTMLRYAIERFPEKKRLFYLHK